MIIILNIIPPTCTAQEKKIDFKRRKIYADQKVVDARAKYRAHLVRYRPEQPLDGPLSMKVLWSFPKGKHETGYCMEKPDLDNANKLLQDVMQELGFFHDDKQIVDLHLTKEWADVPGIVINISQIQAYDAA